MPHRHQLADDDAIPVIVPRNARPLIPVAADRVRRFRMHLVKALHEAQQMKATAPAYPTQPTGFAARVVSAACGLCRGWCCLKGGDDAYLDDRTMARIRRDKPDLDAGSLVRLYSGQVPEVAFEGSCIFHGSKGCSLDRSLRADICNRYFCDGLTAFLSDEQQESARVIIAGHGEEVRTSPVLTP
jgi:hypothetical protein